MALCTRDTGRTGKQMAKDVLYTLMVMFTLALGGMIKLMVWVFILTKTVPGTREIGKTTNNTVRV